MNSPLVLRLCHEVMYGEECNVCSYFLLSGVNAKWYIFGGIPIFDMTFGCRRILQQISIPYVQRKDSLLFHKHKVYGIFNIYVLRIKESQDHNYPACDSKFLTVSQWVFM